MSVRVGKHPVVIVMADRQHCVAADLGFAGFRHRGDWPENVRD
jgi:hypothetical protein